MRHSSAGVSVVLGLVSGAVLSLGLGRVITRWVENGVHDPLTVFGVSLLVISHDLSVIRAVCHRVAVMYKGEIVEHGSTGSVIDHPAQNYTKKLLLAAPVSDPDEPRERREARRLLAEKHSVL